MNTCLMLGNSCVSCWDGHVPCTCQRVQCYAAAAFLAGTFTFLAHEHMLNATPPIEGTKEKRLNQLGNLARNSE